MEQKKSFGHLTIDTKTGKYVFVNPTRKGQSVRQTRSIPKKHWPRLTKSTNDLETRKWNLD